MYLHRPAIVLPGLYELISKGLHIEGNTRTKKGYLVNLFLLHSYFLVCVATDYINHLHCMRQSLFRYRTLSMTLTQNNYLTKIVYVITKTH